MKKALSNTQRIRFQDCDPFGHLNNSKYIDYMLNAREDELREHYNLDMFEMAKSVQKAWVTGKTEIIYKKSALLNEVVYNESRLIEFRKNSVKVEYIMMNEAQTEIKSIMWGSFVHVDLKTQKAAEHSDELLALFDQVHYPIKSNSIEERINELINNKLK